MNGKCPHGNNSILFRQIVGLLKDKWYVTCEYPSCLEHGFSGEALIPALCRSNVMQPQDQWGRLYRPWYCNILRLSNCIGILNIVAVVLYWYFIQVSQIGNNRFSRNIGLNHIAVTSKYSPEHLTEYSIYKGIKWLLASIVWHVISWSGCPWYFCPEPRGLSGKQLFILSSLPKAQAVFCCYFYPSLIHTFMKHKVNISS